MDVNYPDSILKHVLHSIEKTKVIVEKSILGNFFIAKRGIYVKIPHKANKIFVGGFSCKESEELAIDVSRYELAERVLATYNFSDIEKRDSYYELYNAINYNEVGLRLAEEVILGPTHLNPLNDKDAVGLSFHTDMQAAIQHAIFELLERCILGLIWYEQWPVVKISNHIHGNYELTDFTIKLPEPIPFVMTTINDLRLNHFCLGASLSSSHDCALKKSRSEAVMLVNDILNNNNYNSVCNPLSRKKMLSQKDPNLSRCRKSYLDSITYTSKIVERSICVDIGMVLDALSLTETDIGFCILHADKCGYLIRAISNNWRTLADYRKENRDNSIYLLEPVC